MGRMLEGLGLDPEAEAVYRFLLGADRWTVPVVAERLGLTEEAVRDALTRLLALRLLDESESESETEFETETAAGQPLRPVEPHIALEMLLRAQQDELQARQRELEQNQAAVQRLLTEFADLRPRTGQPGTERLLGVEAVLERMAELAERVRFECVSFQPRLQPVALDDVLAWDGALMARGGAIRSVTDTSCLERPEVVDFLRANIAAGAEFRFVDELPMRLVIFDRETALVPLDPGDSRKGALLTTDRGTVAGMYALFEQLWGVAQKLPDLIPAPAAAGLSSTERDVLRLLSKGFTDEAVATRLQLSVRTVRRIVRDLMDRSGARSRFELGARATAQGWLPNGS